MPNFHADKQAAAKWAFNLLEDGNFVVLDGETTSLHLACFVQLAIIDSQGNALFDELINPERDIEEKALSIHKITPDMVADKPNLRHFEEQIKTLTDGKRLIIYNAGFDYPILTRLLEPWTHPKVECAMLEYAKFYGAWSSYHRSYTFQRLPAINKELAHGALADCRSTLALLHHMASWDSEELPF